MSSISAYCRDENLFIRIFLPSMEDVEMDISARCNSLQPFLTPEHLDIPLVFHDDDGHLLVC